MCNTKTKYSLTRVRLPNTKEKCFISYKQNADYPDLGKAIAAAATTQMRLISTAVLYRLFA